MLEITLDRINNPSYGTPTLSGRKLQRYITPEIGWLLTRMDNRAEILKMTVNSEYFLIKEVLTIQGRVIGTIAQKGNAARALRRQKKREYYDELANLAVNLEILGDVPQSKNVINADIKPREKRIEQMREDRKLNKTLAETRKANGINIALLWQAENSLAVSRNDLQMLTASIRRDHAEGKPVKPEAIRAANTLENRTIKAQEDVVKHLQELVRTGKDAESKLIDKLQNEHLAKATKAMLDNVKQVKSIADIEGTESSLSFETLKAYNHEVDPHSQMQEIDDEIYLKKLLNKSY